MENYARKEKKDIKSDTKGKWITIEHIMPKNPNLSEKWQNAIGEEWEEIQKNMCIQLEI